MRWVALVAVLVAACGSAGRGPALGNGSSALVTGDTCALHQDATTCRADAQGCAWYVNTRPCQADPCPAGWCYLSQQTDGGPSSDGGVSASAGCACTGGSSEVCVTQIGGPAVQAASPPPIVCAALPAGCAAPDRCTCLAQGTIERCWSSDQVTNLCICDNGIR